MNLEQKAFDSYNWNAWSELHIITDVVYFGKSIHLHILNHMCFMVQFFGEGWVICSFPTGILDTITMNSKITQTPRYNILLLLENIWHYLAPPKDENQFTASVGKVLTFKCL